MGVGYRIKQFWWELRAGPLAPEERAAVAAVLTAAEIRLFDRLAPSDQVHSLRVMQRLRAAGHHDASLLKAALLHDVGKSCARLTLFDRVAVVLGGRLAPRRLAAWSRWDGDRPASARRLGWRTGFVVKARHAGWGADMAAAAGSDPLTVALIRRHQEPAGGGDSAETTLLRRLQWADDQL